MELSNLSIIAFTLGLFIILCILMGCLLMRRCCPFWVSEKLGLIRRRIFQPELENYSKSPSLFSCNINRSSPGHNINIPIVIVSDENGKRVMAGKDTYCIYEKQDLEEVL